MLSAFLVLAGIFIVGFLSSKTIKPYDPSKHY